MPGAFRLFRIWLMNNDQRLQSLTRTEPSDTVPVSTVSSYGDGSWILDSANRSTVASKRTLHWTFPLGDKTRLDDPVNAFLLSSCRRFIYSLLLGSGIRGSIKAASTIRLYFALRRLLVWMTARGMHRLSLLGPADISAYLSWMKLAGGRNGGPASPTSMYDQVRLIKYLVELQRFMAEEFRFGVPDEYSDVEISSRAQSETPYIPDEIAVPLYREALELVCDHGMASLRFTVISRRLSRRLEKS